jgi:chromosome segregation ATPase
MVVQKASTRKKKGGRTSIRQKQKVVKQKGKQNVFVQVKTAASKQGKTPQIVYGPGGAGAAASSSSSATGGAGSYPGYSGFVNPPAGLYNPVQQPVQIPVRQPSVQAQPTVQPPSQQATFQPAPSNFIKDPNVQDDDRQSTISSLTDSTLVDRSVPQDMDLASLYPDRPQRPKPRTDYGFQGYPGLGPHGGDDPDSGGGPDPDGGAMGIRARVDPFINEAMAAFQEQQAQLQDLMERTERARVMQEVRDKTFADQQAAFMQEQRGLQEAALRSYMQEQLSSLANQARGLFVQLESDLQTNLRASSDRALEQQQDALRREYNAFLEQVDRYRRDRPDAGDGGAALMMQVTQANAELQALQGKLQGVMSRDQALQLIENERATLQSHINAVRADINTALEQRRAEVQAVQDNVRTLRQELSAVGQSIPPGLQSTLTRVQTEIGRSGGNVQQLARDLDQVRSQLTTIPRQASQQLDVAVQNLQRNIGSVQQDLIGRLGASEQRLGRVVDEQIDATRLGIQQSTQADLSQLRSELMERGDAQGQELASAIGDLQQGLSATNVSANALQEQVEQVRQQLASTVSRDESNTQMQRLSQAVTEELGSVQQNIMSEQDRRVRSMLVPYRAAVDILARGSRQQQQVTGNILARMQDRAAFDEAASRFNQEVTAMDAVQGQMQMDAGALPGDSFQAAQGLLGLGPRMGTEQAFNEMTQMGGAQGLMQLAQQPSPPRVPARDFVADLEFIMGGGAEGGGSVPSPPPIPTRTLMSQEPNVMGRGMEPDGGGGMSTEVVGMDMDPAWLFPGGEANTAF